MGFGGRSQSGTFLKVQSVADSGRTEPVFNLEVEGDHTYFVVLPVTSFVRETTYRVRVTASMTGVAVMPYSGVIFFISTPVTSA